MTINSTSSQLIGPNNVRKQNNKVNHSDNLSISPNQPSTPIVLTVAMSSSTTVSPSIFSVRHNQSRLFTLNNGSSNFFGINDRDIPILIGAAAGAIGLIIIILAAILAWYCCQYGIRRQKSSYRLDEENEKWASCSNFGSGVFADNDSVIFTGIENIPNQCVKGHNIRRSLSTQIHLVNPNRDKQFDSIAALDTINPSSEQGYLSNAEATNQLRQSESANVNVCDTNNRCNNQINDNQVNNSSNSNNVNYNVEDEDEYNLDDKYRYNSKSQLYSEVVNAYSDITIDGTNLRTRSLPWKKNSTEADESNKLANNQTKLNFTKKRANRMRNDSAAAIALNRSGATPTHSPYLTKETDCLVDNDSLIANEAVVVYDERTVL
ncbi:probable serine/threonine-protein kinase DDB_G0272254 [Tetranychus urticae]|uniref:probable serine/threonine-protein kinase DDB_G0272254 n=1 Tax=Tetranychus urticae TaxID=32264 RepID=UPI00077BFFAA|nr:probable serine/threonine-protein kinase DDB_G0272254 [Tetranychus urticae]